MHVNLFYWYLFRGCLKIIIFILHVFVTNNARAVYFSYSSPFVLRSFSVRSPFVLRSFSVRSPFILRSFSVRSPFVLRSFSVRSPFVLRSFSVHSPFILRSFSVRAPFPDRRTIGGWTKNKGRCNDYTSVWKRRDSETPTGNQRYGNLTNL